MTMKIELLLSDALDSLKDAPSTSKRRGLIKAIEDLRAGTQENGESHVFKCTGCGSDVPVQSVTCGTCVQQHPPVVTFDIGRLSVAEQDDLIHQLEVIRGQMPPVILDAGDGWDPFRDVEAFHVKFGIGYDGPPRLLPDDAENTLEGGRNPGNAKRGNMAEFRRMFLREEAKEYCTATYRGNHSLHLTADVTDKANEVTEHLTDALDALVDSLYVNLGNAHLHGFTRERFIEAWGRVHAKNMEKVRAAADGSDSKRGTAFDVVKPEGWVAADLSDLVRDHIHQPLADQANAAMKDGGGWHTPERTRIKGIASFTEVLPDIEEPTK